MPKFEDLEMPGAPVAGEEEELDLFEGEEEEGEAAGELTSFSDDDLIAELELRGFEIDPEEGGDEEMSEELPEEESLDEEPSMF